MNMSWIALVIAAGCAGGLGASCNSDDTAVNYKSRPGPVCLPDIVPCTCPGGSVCPADEPVWSKCLEDGSWEKTDLSCVLGLNCRSSADCESGEVCCGDPYTGTWGTQITSSSCRPAQCSSDTVQLCQTSTEC